MKRFVLFFSLFFINSGLFAQEQITITTYYPSPYGVYNTLRFYPVPQKPASDCNASQEGAMYYDQTDRVLSVCRWDEATTSYVWQDLSNSFWSGSLTGNIYNLNSDNVGIGTNTPAAKLEVYKDANSAWRLGEHPSYTSYSALWPPSRGDGAGSYVLLADGTNTFLNAYGAGNIYLREDNNDLMTILNNGNVGIGTAPGAYKLNVAGNALFTGDYLYVNSESAGRLRVGAAWGIPGLYSGDDGAKDLVIGVPAANKVNIGTSGNFMVVKGDGDVGIRTTDPQFNLDIQGDGEKLFRLVRDGNPAGRRLAIKSAPGAGNPFRFDTGDYYQFQTDGNTRFQIGASGEITAIDVYNSTNSNPANVRVTTTGRLVRATSSRRYKKNVRPFKDDFSKILKAQPKKFDDLRTGEQSIGYIAEEFNDLGLKDLVEYGKEGKPEGLNYNGVSLYLVEVVKDLKSENDALKQRIKILEGKIK